MGLIDLSSAILSSISVQLFDIDIQSIAILRTVGLEVEDHANSFTTQCLLIKHAFNRVHGFFVRVISTRGELAILDSPDRVSERFQRWVDLVPEPTVEATLGYNWRTPSAYLQTEPVPDPERSRNGYPRCPSCRSFSQYGLSLGPTLSALNSFLSCAPG
jgi:hypothetical protein